MTFSKNAIKIDAAAEASRIVDRLRRSVRQVLRRSGAVLGISGGVDSSVVLALCVRAFGADRREIRIVLGAEIQSLCLLPFSGQDADHRVDAQGDDADGADVGHANSIAGTAAVSLAP